MARNSIPFRADLRLSLAAQLGGLASLLLFGLLSDFLVAAQVANSTQPDQPAVVTPANDAPLWVCPDEDSQENPACQSDLQWQPQPGDEIWLVNTRNLDSCINDCRLAPQLPVSQWQAGEFQSSSLPELLESVARNPELRNVTYIHGNFTDYGWSIRRGMEVYHHCFGGCGPRPPIRFIIWSWRSERETLLGRDYQIKSQRAVAEGCRLNSLVSQLGPQPPIVIGYSLGAQATLSALSQPASADAQAWVVTLIAAALDPHFCGNLRDNQQISNRVERLVLFTNQSDPALNCSIRITRRTIANPNPPSQYSIVPNLRGGRATLEQFEVSREVGRHHAISRYLESPTVSSHLQNLLSDLAPRQAPAASTPTDPAAAGR